MIHIVWASLCLRRPEAAARFGPATPQTSRCRTAGAASVDGNDNIWICNLSSASAGVVHLRGFRTENCRRREDGRRDLAPERVRWCGLQMQVDVGIGPAGDVWVTGSAGRRRSKGSTKRCRFAAAAGLRNSQVGAHAAHQLRPVVRQRKRPGSRSCTVLPRDAVGYRAAHSTNVRDAASTLPVWRAERLLANLGSKFRALPRARLLHWCGSIDTPGHCSPARSEKSDFA